MPHLQSIYNKILDEKYDTRCSLIKLPLRILISTIGFAIACVAQTSSAVISIDTTTSSPLAAGLSGFNVPQLRNGVEYFDPKFLNAVSPLQPGWVRFPGGTDSLAFDWQAGHVNTAWMNSLISGNPPLVGSHTAQILTTSQQLAQAKGGVWFYDFANFAKTLNASAIVCFNSYTDTNPSSAGILVLLAQALGVNVTEWELANEAYIYPTIFPTAASYAAAMNTPYYNDIVSAAPNATVGLFMSGTTTDLYWDQGLSSYTPRYWNSTSFHYYPIQATHGGVETALILNGILAHGTVDYINSYLLPLIGADAPIFITELNCCTGQSNPFLTYLYNGIFLSEYIARMSTVPNVKAVGINSLYTDNADYHGLIQSVNDFESYLLAQVAANPNFSTNTATDPNTQFQFYTSAPGLAIQVANQAINNSVALWPTTVSGGTTVQILGYDGLPIPSIFAQAYEGKDGSNYLLITNKDDVVHAVTVQANGANVNGALNIATVSNSNGNAANTAQSPNTVMIQTSVSYNPISIGPYSVTTVNW